MTYNPRLILGTNKGEFAVGMRNALGVQLFRDLLDFELGHQFTVSHDIFDHEFIMLTGSNIPAFLYNIPTGWRPFH